MGNSTSEPKAIYTRVEQREKKEPNIRSQHGQHVTLPPSPQTGTPGHAAGAGSGFNPEPVQPQVFL